MTKHIADDDQLYTGLKTIAYQDAEESDNLISTQEELEAALAAAPNGSLFGSSYYRVPFSWGVTVWNKYSEKQTPFARWMTKTFGKQPVLMSWVNPELRSSVAQNVLRNHGYFNGRVTHDVITQRNPKEAKIQYTVTPGQLYYIDSIDYVGFPAEADSMIRSTLDEASIHRGDPFVVSRIEAERQRISTLLRNNGYYYYQPAYASYLADTFVVDGKAQLQLRLANEVPETATHPWYIGRININMKKTFMEQPTDSFRGRFFTIRYSGKNPPIRPRVLLADMKLRPRKAYSYNDYLETTSKINAMGLFSMTDFQFTPRDTLPTCDTLDLKLSCVFDKPYDFYVETRASGSSVGRLGPELVVGLSKRNAFRGGEKLDVALHGSYAWQINGGSNNYYEYGFEASVEFPRLVAPFFGGNRVRPRRSPDGRPRRRRFFSTPTTLARISNNVINRPGYFNMNTITGEWTYKWQPSETSRFQFSPLILQYQFKNRVSSKFTALQDSLMFIGTMTEDKLVPQMRFTYTYSSPASYRNPIVWETTFSEAGNLVSLGMMAFGKKWNEKNKNLYKTPYSQFLKVETDFTKTWHVSEYSTLVAHLNLGLMYNYGNSYTDQAPFSEYFYVGGANTLRGWSVRDIGPGNFDFPIHDRSMRYLRLGTIKGVANVEFRPRLFGNLYGAVFLDAGNVWLHNTLLEMAFAGALDAEPGTGPTEISGETSGEISDIDVEATANEFLKLLSSFDSGKFSFKNIGTDIAINTGIGLRYDLGFITLRLDWGLGLHLPYATSRRGFFNADTFGRDQSLHFAVGMPF